MIGAAPQLESGGLVEVAQQLALPAVPELGIGGADISHGQQVQAFEPFPVAHLFGESAHHFWILDILLLCRDRHQQVVLHQPGHHFDVGPGAAQAAQVAAGIAGAQLRVVPAAALGDIVEDAGVEQQLWLAHALRQLVGEFELLVGFRFEKAFQIANQEQRVLIDGVDMEQIVLHPSADTRKGGQQCAEQTMAVHFAQGAERPARAQDRFQRLVGQPILGQGPSESGQGLGQRLSQIRAQCARAGIPGQALKGLHQIRRGGESLVAVQGFDGVFTQAEVLAAGNGRQRRVHFFHAARHAFDQGLREAVDIAGCAKVPVHQ